MTALAESFPRLVKGKDGIKTGLLIRGGTALTIYKGSLIAHREGSELREVPDPLNPRADLIYDGIATNEVTITTAVNADSSGAAVDADGNNFTLNTDAGLCAGFDTGTSTNAITSSMVGQACYGFDSNTLYATSNGGTLSFVGLIYLFDEDGTVIVDIEAENPLGTYIFGAAGATPNVTQNTDVRCVITTIAAYVGTGTGTLTASATGAIGAQDTTETLVAGDLVFLPLVTGGAGGATVAKDTGVWQVVDPGGATKFKLTRPTVMKTAATVKPGMTVRVQFGTLWGGGDWKSFVLDAAQVVDTNDPLFWPRQQEFTSTVGGALSPTVVYLRTATGWTAANKTSAHANWASTITPGQGNAALTFTGTASDVMVCVATNF